MTDDGNATAELITCRRCDGRTRHDLICRHDVQFDEIPDDFAFMSEVWDMLSCRGCGAVCVRRSFSTDFNYNFSTEQVEPDVSLFPSARPPHAMSIPALDLPPRLRGLHREVIDAFNQELFTLCAVGIRALVEGACLERGIEGGQVPVFDKERSCVFSHSDHSVRELDAPDAAGTVRMGALGPRLLSLFRARFRTPFHPSSEPREFGVKSHPARIRALRACRKQREFRTRVRTGEPTFPPAQRAGKLASLGSLAPRQSRRHNSRSAPMLRRRSRDTAPHRLARRPAVSHKDSPRDSHPLCCTRRVPKWHTLRGHL